MKLRLCDNCKMNVFDSDKSCLLGFKQHLDAVLAFDLNRHDCSEECTYEGVIMNGTIEHEPPASIETEIIEPCDYRLIARYDFFSSDWSAS